MKGGSLFREIEKKKCFYWYRDVICNNGVRCFTKTDKYAKIIGKNCCERSKRDGREEKQHAYEFVSSVID